MSESNRLADVATALSADVPRLLEVLGLGDKRVVSLDLRFRAGNSIEAYARLEVTESELHDLVEELREQKPEKQALLSVSEIQ